MVPRAGFRLGAAPQLALLLAIALAKGCAAAEIPVASPATILLVVNDNSPLSRTIGEYYARRRGVPLSNICHLKASTAEEISHDDYDRQIARPMGVFLRKQGLLESIYYIVTTAGVPLKIAGTGDGMTSSAASVDSELALLYADLRTGKPHRLEGAIANPLFGKRDRAFS